MVIADNRTAMWLQTAYAFSNLVMQTKTFEKCQDAEAVSHTIMNYLHKNTEGLIKEF